MRLIDFDDDIALLILNQLIPKDLVCLQLTCKWGKGIARHESLWKDICAERFTIWNSHLLSASPGNYEAGHAGRYQELYAKQNGWKCPKLSSREVRVKSSFISSMHPFNGAALSWDSRGDLIALGTADGVLVTAPPDEAGELSSRALPPPKAEEAQHSVIQSLAALPGHVLAAGSDAGAIQFHSLDEDTVCLTHILQACLAPCVDLQYCQAAKKLYSIHDDTFKMLSPAQRNALQAVDVEQQAFTARATEFSEECELLCFAPAGDAAGDWGNELVAGAVHGSFCLACYQTGLPSLCYHKATTATAALCMFDLRASLNMVQRFGTHHRSLYPRICCARGTYIFTSHVGIPVCVWDRRCMSMPVWEEQQLGNFSHGYPPQMPFQAPLRAGSHSALYLCVDAGGDQLVGRAENGMLWLWDLTATLGWQQRQSRGPQGSWHDRASSQPWVGDTYFSDWPQQLGAWPCETSLPQTHIQNGGSYQLTGLCSDPWDSDYVTVAQLLP